MDINLEYEESELELYFEEEKEIFQAEFLQKTPEWQEERKGNWTGSRFKNVMQCSSAGGKLSWDNPAKVYLFSKGAVKYIYENAMERKTGRYIESSPTWDMRYGTIIEPLTERRFSEWLIENDLNLTRKSVGYKSFPAIGTAGVSSDSVLEDDKNNVVASCEFKACTSWSSHYNRTFESTDESSVDFWQTQGQMLAWEVDKTFYVTISPPKDIKKYLFAEDIEEMYEEWINETEMTVEVVKKSPFHHSALLKRLEIMESTAQKWLKDTSKNLVEILYEEIDSFKKLNNEDYEDSETAQKSIEKIDSIASTESAIKDEIIEEKADSSASYSQSNVIKKTESNKNVNFEDDDIPF